MKSDEDSDEEKEEKEPKDKKKKSILKNDKVIYPFDKVLVVSYHGLTITAIFFSVVFKNQT